MPNGPITSTIHSMADVWEAYRDELEGVEDQVRKNLDSSVTLVNTVAAHILNSGGKRIRPLLLLLCARLCGYSGRAHHQLSSLAEFIHTATLLHDDVVDDADLRRGHRTARKFWGNQISILVGDYLYSKAIAQIVEFRSQGINEVLAEACTKMAEGEVLQLMNCHNAGIDEHAYLRVIRYKTAKLFEAATRLGAILGGATPEEEAAMANYGMHLGTAFQLIDDVLDYSGDNKATGKNVGDDLAEGKPTLPLIYAIKHGSATEAALIRKAIEEGGLDELEQVIAAIQRSGALDYTRRQAQAEARTATDALAALPNSKYRDSLLQLADFAVTRDY